METYVITEENYAETLRALRRKQHMTQHYVAVLMHGTKRSQIRDNQVCMWETRVMVPLTNNLFGWANALGCDVVLVPRHQDDDESNV